MKNIFSFFIAFLLFSPNVKSQNNSDEAVKLPDHLWAIGSAIPNGKIELSKVKHLDFFLYNGQLLSGDFKIIDTENINQDTRFIVPLEEDVDITGDTKLQITHDASLPGWNVMVPDSLYLIKINVSEQDVKAEVFNPNKTLYIVGGATNGGWNPSKAIPFVRDKNNPYLFIFDGELSIRPEHEQGSLFKILGQLDWNPYSLHPSTPNESPLNSRVVRVNGEDNKWAIDEEKQGRYIIEVNTLTETIDARYLGN